MSNLDALDLSYVRHILRIYLRARISNEVYQRTDQPPLTHFISRLKFFSHTARADPSMDRS